MKRYLLLALLLLSKNLYSQNKEMIYLWPGNVPGEQKEKHDVKIAASKNDNVIRLSEVTNPAIEVRLVTSAGNNGCGVIVCPGGGYSILAWDLEGTEIADWLNNNGYSAFILQYRVPDKKEGALQDAQRALRIVRANAAKWHLDPEKIGIMGFSAGGSLSARASTNFNRKTYQPVDMTDSLSCRPSFTMLIYPAYLDEGENKTLTPELKLTKDTPPVFIFQTSDDPYGNSAVVMGKAMRDNNLPVELHLIAKGGHGYGLRSGKDAAETWPLLAEKWLDSVIKGK